MKKVIVSFALIAFIAALAVPSILASSGKPLMMQQDTKVAAQKDDKKSNKSCANTKGSCCKDKSKDASSAPGKTDKK